MPQNFSPAIEVNLLCVKNIHPRLVDYNKYYKLIYYRSPMLASAIYPRPIYLRITRSKAGVIYRVR